MAHEQHHKRKSRISSVLRPGMSQDAGARVVLRANVASFATHLARLIVGHDVGATHQTRVALRRLRAALEAFAPGVDADLHRRLKRRLRCLFQALGTVRDAEVLAQRAGQSGAALLAEANRKRHDLRKTLKAQHALRLPEDLADVFAGKSWRKDSKTARRLRKAPIEGLAAGALDRAWLRATGCGPTISTLSEVGRHELRKRIKSFRYMAEDFAPLWPADASAGFLTLLSALQEVLGHLNDIALARDRALAPEPGVVEAALAQADDLWSEVQRRSLWWRPSAPV